MVKRKHLIIIVGLIILLAAVPVTLIVIRETQKTRSEAAGISSTGVNCGYTEAGDLLPGGLPRIGNLHPDLGCRTFLHPPEDNPAISYRTEETRINIPNTATPEEDDTIEIVQTGKIYKIEGSFCFLEKVNYENTLSEDPEYNTIGPSIRQSILLSTKGAPRVSDIDLAKSGVITQAREVWASDGPICSWLPEGNTGLFQNENNPLAFRLEMPEATLLQNLRIANKSTGKDLCTQDLYIHFTADQRTESYNLYQFTLNDYPEVFDSLCNPPDLPDIKVSNLRFYDSFDILSRTPGNEIQEADLNKFLGQPIWVGASLKNAGLADIKTTFTTEFILASQPETANPGRKMEFTHSPLGAGQDSTDRALFARWDEVTSGTLTFSFEGDSKKVVTESDESNNCNQSNRVCKTVTIGPPPDEGVCNKPQGLCVRAKADLDHQDLQTGPAQYEIWVNGSRLRRGNLQLPLRIKVPSSGKLEDENKWQVDEFDLLNEKGQPTIDKNSIVRIAYVNERYDGDPPKDRNLYIDWVEIAGKRIQAEEAEAEDDKNTIFDVGLCEESGPFGKFSCNHDRGMDCEQVASGREKLPQEGMLRFNETTCKTQGKVNLGDIKGKIFINPTYDQNGKLVGPGEEVRTPQSSFALLLNYLGAQGVFEDTKVTDYNFKGLWVGSHTIKIRNPGGWKIKYRVCRNSDMCHLTLDEEQYQNLLTLDPSTNIARVEIPTTGPTDQTNGGRPYLSIYWYVTPK